ncbi:hypothetical protein B0T09DRAFT_156966 [Sordaria sp. MPI-SDFR-AT-0083]|nr:hypothetical protein B0T09DRAFT_156966 [Sordaria sp. MPI-SDFR-AT-0083]
MSKTLSRQSNRGLPTLGAWAGRRWRRHCLLRSNGSLNVRRPRLSMSSFSSTHRSSFGFFLHMIAAFISSCRCASRVPSTPEVLGVSSSWGCSHDASTFCLPYPASVRPPVKSLHRRQITSLQQMSQLHQYRRLFIVRLENGYCCKQSTIAETHKVQSFQSRHAG